MYNMLYALCSICSIRNIITCSRVITYEQGTALAKQMGATYVEASAKNNEVTNKQTHRIIIISLESSSRPRFYVKRNHDRFYWSQFTFCKYVELISPWPNLWATPDA